MKLLRKVGATSEIWQIVISDTSSTTGGGLTGLTNATSNLIAYYHRDTDTTATAISLVTMTVGTFTSSGFKEVDATNMPGVYQFCPPNAAIASGAKSCIFRLQGAANMAQLTIEVDLDAQVDVTFWNGTVVATPATPGIPDVNAKNINNVATTSVTTINANQGTTQPLNFTGTAGSALVKSDMIDILGTAVSTPATAGILDVNVKNMNNVAGTSITTVNANQGTTQPVNFTGTGASALAKSDMVDVAGAAVSTSTAQIGVNVVNWNGTAATSTVPPDAIFIRSGTAQAGAGSTITLDAGASATDNLYKNEVIFIRSGTGAGQSNIIASYVGSTKVATVSNAWATNPDNTSVFTVMAPGPVIASVSGTVTANVTQWNGTNVASPATAGIPDVNVKNVNNLVSSGNAAFGPVWDVVRASHTTSGTFGGDTVTPPTNFSSLGISAGGAINEVTLTDTLTTYTGNTVQTGDAFARLGVAGVGLTNLGDTRIANLDAAVSSRMATYTQPTGFLAATFPSGTVANTTNITAGTITTVTNLTNAATAGDLTATMKTSVTTAATAATPTAAAVTGAVGSVTAAVTVGTINAAATNVKKNTASAGFTFLMTDSTTHLPKTGVTVTATRSIDGGSFGACTNSGSISEVSSGVYSIDLSAADVNGNHIMLLFTGTASDNRYIEIITQP